MSAIKLFFVDMMFHKYNTEREPANRPVPLFYLLSFSFNAAMIWSQEVPSP
jgi:hypothetical protein